MSWTCLRTAVRRTPFGLSLQDLISEREKIEKCPPSRGGLGLALQLRLRELGLVLQLMLEGLLPRVGAFGLLFAGDIVGLGAPDFGMAVS